MALSPFDVEHKTFRTALRGYAEEEVDEFLDEVVASLRDYEQKVRDATELAGVLESKLAASRETETAIKRTFIAAQRTADQIIEEAQQEATRLVSDAKAEEAQYESERQAERARARAEVEAMADAVNQLRETLERFAEGARDEVAELETHVDEVSQTYGLQTEEPSIEIPALVGEGDLEAEDIEYFDADDSNDEHLVSEVDSPESDDEESSATDELSSDDLDVGLDEEEIAEGQAILRKPRPRRPWERDG